MYRTVGSPTSPCMHRSCHCASYWITVLEIGYMRPATYPVGYDEGPEICDVGLDTSTCHRQYFDSVPTIT